MYLLYAHARIASIVRKSGKDMAQVALTANITLKEDKEVALALHICRFPGKNQCIAIGPCHFSY